ncbi:hypothetical protein ZWY2020_057179 [Hordeum vulgare]|nr:hypothetical protein ZWY2020_057179 [Hordeum vulgare]
MVSSPPPPASVTTDDDRYQDPMWERPTHATRGSSSRLRRPRRTHHRQGGVPPPAPASRSPAGDRRVVFLSGPVMDAADLVLNNILSSPL